MVAASVPPSPSIALLIARFTLCRGQNTCSARSAATEPSIASPADAPSSATIFGKAMNRASEGGSNRRERARCSAVRVGVPSARDPDRHSTWNTIEGTVNVDEVLDEDDLENFFVEPIPNPLNPAATSDVTE